MVNAEVSSGGELSVAGQIVGRLQGFRLTPETNGGGDPAEKNSVDVVGALAQEFEVRANRLSEAVDSALVLANDGAIRWFGDPVAKITGGEKLLEPRALILADEALTETAQQKVQGRVDLWLNAYVHRLLGPLFELDTGVGLEGPARNVAKQLVEALGVLERGRVAQDVKALDQNARGMLRKLGVRFGAHYVFIPSLVKPAIRVLATQLWALRQNGAAAGAGLDEIPQLAASGRTSFVADSAIPKETYRVAGFRLCGERAVRVDIVERLADLIRPAITYRPGPGAGPPPPGSADGDGFVVTGAMTSLTGCSGEQFASVLRSLGFVSHQVKGPALTIAATAPEAAPTSGVATLEAEKNPAAEYAETALVEPAPPDPIEAPDSEISEATDVEAVSAAHDALDAASPEAAAEEPGESEGTVLGLEESDVAAEGTAPVAEADANNIQLADRPASSPTSGDSEQDPPGFSEISQGEAAAVPVSSPLLADNVAVAEEVLLRSGGRGRPIGNIGMQGQEAIIPPMPPDRSRKPTVNRRLAAATAVQRKRRGIATGPRRRRPRLRAPLRRKHRRKSKAAGFMRTAAPGDATTLPPKPNPAAPRLPRQTGAERLRNVDKRSENVRTLRRRGARRLSTLIPLSQNYLR